jgi:hypothetical protein
MTIEGNTATIKRDTDDYRIVISVQRKGPHPITQDEVQKVLTSNIPTMFTQKITF